MKESKERQPRLARSSGAILGIVIGCLNGLQHVWIRFLNEEVMLVGVAATASCLVVTGKDTENDKLGVEVSP